MQPYSQPLLWWKTTGSVTGPEKYWFNGVPYVSLPHGGLVSGGMQFWFNGVPSALSK